MSTHKGKHAWTAKVGEKGIGIMKKDILTKFMDAVMSAQNNSQEPD